MSATSSTPVSSTHDLRAHTTDRNRSLTRKHKPFAYQPPSALHPTAPRYKSAFTTSHARHSKTSKTHSHGARATAGVVGSLGKIHRKNDTLAAESTEEEVSASSASSADENGKDAGPAPDAGIAYSFDAAKGPSGGSQILNGALARALEVFEEKETVKLVRTEYDVLDSEGESVGLVRGSKKGKGKAAVADDGEEDYEFV